MATPPYGIIAPQLLDGMVVPFLGAAASFYNRKGAFDPKNPRVLPNGKELAEALAKDCGFPSQREKDREDLAKVTSYYSEVSADRYTLRTRLRQLLARQAWSEAETSSPKPITLHTLLARMPKLRLIVTTNYDSLIEDAFDEIQRPYDLVIYPADSKEHVNCVLWCPHGGEPKPIEAQQLDMVLDLSTTTVIYKMHGSRHPTNQSLDHYVITEEDYLEFLSRMTKKTAIPPAFESHFAERSFLFLGYGLSDWNLRLLLKNLRLPEKRNGGTAASETRRSWAIQWKPTELDLSLWQSRDVNIHDMDLNEFVMQLATEAGLIP